ncbi:7-deoxyloganetin glucosyltransferase-like [Punica granatum]|uniref:Glycosyltransferase n=2 Tax=Punica granatum TaxID=22663 RepID=A0A218VST1_PUNGR|nr:7-deoxyloganetin glucosyltransferase-like [Punica granatum]OWM63607.1 hypothetical protein CDL15_Pgr008150 [Punica granatum]PKI48728.1 hypothetical protein CRG98_030869 [Punica granatum]
MDKCSMKPHVLCIPHPAQGHINPMLKLAKLLHFKGFYVTFVHTEFNYNRLAKSDGRCFLPGSTDFRYEVISDGLPPTNPRGILDLPSLSLTLPVEGLRSFRELVKRLIISSDDGAPPLSCIVSDGVMSFTIEVARESGIPEMILFTPSGCGMLGYLQFERLMENHVIPLKDESCLSNGYLDTTIDWVAPMGKIRLWDLPTFIRTTNPDDIMLNYNLESINNTSKADGVILNTFDDLEHEVLEAIRTKFPNLYTIGPLPMLHQELSSSNLSSFKSNLWKEDTRCLDWLEGREPGSVVYVNFGSLIIMTSDQLNEFAWGLANSKYHFLWVIRPDLVDGGDEAISKAYLDEITDRGLLVEWCPQERVLAHPSVGVFLTHCGWNSTLESISGGVPIICWPFFAEQQTNCLYSCTEWGVGLEIDSDAKRGKVEGIVREMMEGETGKRMKESALRWRMRGLSAVRQGGSSYTNFVRLVECLKGGVSSD